MSIIGLYFVENAEEYTSMWLENGNFMTTVSIIIPVYDSANTLDKCLGAARRAIQPSDEIIVVADDSNINDILIAKEFDVHIIPLSERVGPAKARNHGAKIAQGDLLFFVDSDVVIPHDAVERVRAIFDLNPNIAAAIGSYDDSPAENNFLSQYRNLLHHFVHQTSSPQASTFWGACGAIRRNVFLSTTGYNEDYELPSVEDIELGYRLVTANHEIRLEKSLQVKHLKRWNLQNMLITDIFQRAIPWSKLILSKDKLINDLNLKMTSRWSSLLIGLLLFSLGIATKRRAWVIITALASFLLLFLNARFYIFLLRKRNLWFTIRVIPFHWLYYLYSGLAFSWVFSQHHAGRWRNR